MDHNRHFWDRSMSTMLVNCSHCRTPLQLPPATNSIRCSFCFQITYIATSFDPPPPTPPPLNPTFDGFYHSQPPPPPCYAYDHTPPPSPPYYPCYHTPPPSPPYYSTFDHTPPPSPPHYPPFNNKTPNPPPHAISPVTQPPNNPHLPPFSPVTHTPSFLSHSSPQQYQPEPGRKKAVICGISYKGMNEELKGCINDARCMKYLLIQRFSFPESNILMLITISLRFIEEETSSCNIPTKRNIQSALRWLVEGSRPGDSLVFHYSGHGSQQKDTDGDEIDGLDETICPLDYHQNGMIVDDWINETIVRPLHSGVKLHAIIDSCHSGTVLDLPYLCRMNRSGQYEWEDHRPRTGVFKGTSGGEVYSFSGCDDNQSSADTDALSKTTSTGAMTFAFIQAIERGEGRTYGTLLNSMRSAIRNVGDARSVGFVTQVMGMLLQERPVSEVGPQEPQLTSNEQFDVYKKPFSL